MRLPRPPIPQGISRGISRRISMSDLLRHLGQTRTAHMRLPIPLAYSHGISRDISMHICRIGASTTASRLNIGLFNIGLFNIGLFNIGPVTGRRRASYVQMLLMRSLGSDSVDKSDESRLCEGGIGGVLTWRQDVLDAVSRQ